MVLADLGKRITHAINSMGSSTVLDHEVIKKMLNEINRALLEADVNIGLIKPLTESIRAIDIDSIAGGINKRKIIHRAVLEELSKLLDPGPDAKLFVPRKGRSNVIMFVGLQGSGMVVHHLELMSTGKTTTITKYCAYYQRKGWKTALVCADTFRAGAFDQLKQNATRARVPFYGSYTETDPVRLAADGADKFREDGFEIICVDTSGRHKQAAELFTEMEDIRDAVKPEHVVFVLDSNIGQGASAQAKEFHGSVEFGSIIATKMDGHGKGGGALSAAAATKTPVCFIGTGEGMYDLELFEPKRFLSRLLGMGDVQGLIETMQDVGMEEQMAMAGRMMQGQFTLRDLYDQFSNILKMGPLDQVMSMLPGFSAEIMKQYKGREANARIKGFLVMMDSMTAEELDTNAILGNNSRISRVARGSGRSVREVGELLTEFKRFQKMVKGVGKLSTSNPRGNMAQNLSRVMDPRVLKQMGGTGGLQSMVKNLAGSMGGGENPFGM